MRDGRCRAHKPEPDGSVRRIGLIAGPALALTVIALPAPHGLSAAAWMTAAAALWMAIWWMSEAVPLAVTALLPLVLFPLLGVSDLRTAAAPFSNPIIFLFLGGFWMALGMQRWELHRRIAIALVSRVGRRPRALVAGVMGATALISMWVSNTATAMMMLPIASSLVGDRPDDGESSGFRVAMILGVAYGASIGGLATLVGSPPNALAAGFLGDAYGIEITFARWLAFGLPVVVVLLPLCWLVLTRVAIRVPAAQTAEDAADVLPRLAPMSAPEWRLAAVVALVAILWITSPLLAGFGADFLTDAGIAVAGAGALFLIPSGRARGERLLDWSWARQAPWDILLLFGGGLSLAHAVDNTGLAASLGHYLEAIADWHPALLVLTVVALVIFLTELTSNTATAATFLPIVAALAVAARLDPVLLTVAAALAASCAFMLPVATPPNAIVFSAGHVTLPQMMRAGWWLNVTAVAIILGAAMVWRWLAP